MWRSQPTSAASAASKQFGTPRRPEQPRTQKWSTREIAGNLGQRGAPKLGGLACCPRLPQINPQWSIEGGLAQKVVFVAVRARCQCSTSTPRVLYQHIASTGPALYRCNRHSSDTMIVLHKSSRPWPEQDQFCNNTSKVHLQCGAAQCNATQCRCDTSAVPEQCNTIPMQQHTSTMQYRTSTIVVPYG